jgi:hypothetical protein
LLFRPGHLAKISAASRSHEPSEPKAARVPFSPHFRQVRVKFQRPLTRETAQRICATIIFPHQSLLTYHHGGSGGESGKHMGLLPEFTSRVDFQILAPDESMNSREVITPVIIYALGILEFCGNSGVSLSMWQGDAVNVCRGGIVFALWLQSVPLVEGVLEIDVPPNFYVLKPLLLRTCIQAVTVSG